MKLIAITIAIIWFFEIFFGGCGKSRKSKSYYRNIEQRAERAKKRAERQRIAAQLVRPHKAPSQEYLKRYASAQEVRQRRKMEDLKMQMKAEAAENRYTGP